jgi:hypothetical protein
MPRKRLNNSLIVTTIIERDQHDRLRELAFYDHVTMAEMIREALGKYLKSRTNRKKVPVGK